MNIILNYIRSRVQERNMIKSYTDLEQSKKLAEILPLESADMYYWCADHYPKEDWIIEVGEPDDNYECICAWSLAALRNLLPVAIKVNENTYLFESHNTFDKSWVYRYYNEDDTSYLYYKNTSEIDACVAMIEKLYELNLL